MSSKGKQKRGTGKAQKNSSKPKPLQPRPGEWNFRPCPDDELLHCFIYEYARESEDFCNGFAEWKRTVPKWKIGYVVVSVWDGVAFSLRSDFVELAPKRRKSVFDFPVQFSGTAFRRVKESWSIGLDRESGEEVDLFEISWAWPGTKIIEDFARWLCPCLWKEHSLGLRTG